LRESNESNIHALNQVEVLKGDLAEATKNVKVEMDELKTEVKELESKNLKLEEEAKLAEGMKKLLRRSENEETMSLISLFKNGAKVSERSGQPNKDA